MSREETLNTILSAEAYWGSPRTGSWPDCGAVPPKTGSPMFRSLESSNDITEEDGGVDRFDMEEGLQTIWRESEESLEDFKSRVAIFLGETAALPTNET